MSVSTKCIVSTFLEQSISLAKVKIGKEGGFNKFTHLLFRKLSYIVMYRVDISKPKIENRSFV